jgi:hypothetical protein
MRHNQATFLPHAASTGRRKSSNLLIINELNGDGRGACCRLILILNKLLKTLDAPYYQNAGNAVLEYATSTRDFRRQGSNLVVLDPSHDLPVGISANEIFYGLILAARSTSGSTGHPAAIGKTADGLTKRNCPRQLRITSGLAVIRPEPGSLRFIERIDTNHPERQGFISVSGS